jgi:hypothetical protein
MPDASEPLDPYEALTHIRTFARVALNNDDPSLDTYERIMREILNATDKAMPRKPKAKRSIPSNP